MKDEIINKRSRVQINKRISLTNSKLITFLIKFSWYFGCIPFDNKSFHLDPLLSLQPIYNNRMFYYSMTLIIFKLMLYIGFLIYGIEKTAKLRPSKLILQSFLILLWVASDFLRRLYYILNAGIMKEFFAKLNEFNDKMDDNKRKSKRDFIGQHGKHGRISNLTACLIAVSLALNLIDFANEGFPFVLKLYENGTLGLTWTIISGCVLLFVGFTEVSSKLLSIVFMVLIGQELLQCYEQILGIFLEDQQDNLKELDDKSLFILEEMKLYTGGVRDFVTESKSNPRRTRGQNFRFGKDYSKTFNHFELLRTCFHLYSKLAGFLIILSIAQSSGVLIYNSYSLAFGSVDGQLTSPWRWIIEGIEKVIMIYLMAYIGQTIQDTMEIFKIRIRKCLVKMALEDGKNSGGSTSQQYNFEGFAMANEIMVFQGYLSDIKA